MRHQRGQAVEVESLEELEQRLAKGAHGLAGWRLKGLDLTAHGPQLAARRPAGALFLGCRFAPGDEELLRRLGSLVFPTLPGIPIDAYRTRLYAAHDLYDAEEYDDSTDARAYAWSRLGTDPTLAQALHDHAIDDALDDWVRGRRLVGVMGGHALERGSTGYRRAARLGQLLGGSHVVATGGGPGAMEAANLGARFAHESPQALDSAIATLSAVPAYQPDVRAWARAAFEVMQRWPAAATDTLGIPTWHYGHEPPNAFSTAIAKYFRNATREAILLQVCEAGIIFLPGAAGTVQEVFQDACENYYADESAIAPMVLVGREHWTRTLPAWQLLSALAAGRAMADHIHLVETVEEAAALVNAR